ncbi:MAG TPA: hypothetical protein VFI02_06475 [Armatimonadota bacterium]|nr:hypothetical protein [Armatimonadota bacterium]
MQDTGNQSFRYAGFWLRFVAWIIDGVIMLIPGGMTGACGGFVVGSL